MQDLRAVGDALTKEGIRHHHKSTDTGLNVIEVSIRSGSVAWIAADERTWLLCRHTDQHTDSEVTMGEYTTIADLIGKLKTLL